MDHGVLNATNSDEAHWRMQWDPGLAWLCLGTLNPFTLSPDTHLILRRYKGNKYPQPEAAAAVGYARNAAAVSGAGGVTYANGDTYWHYIDQVDKGGMVAEGGGELALPVLWGGAGAAPALPNRPVLLQQHQSKRDTIVLTWLHDGVGEAANPASFEIYTDSGTGTFSGTAYETVPFEAGRRLYAWESPAGVGSRWLWQVRAKSAAAVLSWWATTPSGGIEQQVSYAAGALDARLGVTHPLISAAPATPPAPEFAT